MCTEGVKQETLTEHQVTSNGESKRDISVYCPRASWCEIEMTAPRIKERSSPSQKPLRLVVTRRFQCHQYSTVMFEIQFTRISCSTQLCSKQSNL